MLTFYNIFSPPKHFSYYWGRKSGRGPQYKKIAENNSYFNALVFASDILCVVDRILDHSSLESAPRWLKTRAHLPLTSRSPERATFLVETPILKTNFPFLVIMSAAVL